MGSSGVKAASSASWNGKWNSGKNSGKQGAKQSGGLLGAEGAGWDRDSVSLSSLARMFHAEEQDRQADDCDDAQLKRLIDLLRQSNVKIAELAFHRTSRKIRPKAIPSILGMPVKEAAARLAANNLKIQDVRLEFSDSVPPGHVVSQLPVPGLALTKVGIRLTVSKGQGPDRKTDNGGNRQGAAAASADDGQKLLEEILSEIAIMGVVPMRVRV